MSNVNYKKVYAIKETNKKRLLKVNPDLKDVSGIYFLTRTDEEGFNHAYVGQAVKVLDRLISHLSGYQQHIDLSIRKHGLYSDDNPYGWKINYMRYPESELDDMEKHWIKKYALNGYQMKNVTIGGQGKGKSDLNERKPSRTYQDGLRQGYINASKEIAHLFELHLGYYTKNPMPTVNQKKAMEKFEEFLKAYKI